MVSIVRAFAKSVIPVLALTLTLTSGAQALTKPTGPVVLTISGKIGQKNTVSAAEFDEAMLDALPVARIATTTPWRKGVVTFTGPTLKSVLALVGASGQTLRMAALDQYEVKVPFDDAEKFTPLLARKIDGVTLKVRDMGPLFMIYPFDELPALKNDLYYGRAIWHLTSIVVE